MEITITQRVWKITNNLVITIPKNIVDKLGLKPDDLLEAKIKKVE